mgnify:FL=1
MIIKAREFAILHHGDQQYGVHPYSVHLDAVASITSAYGESAEVVAYLHDVVEDTQVSTADIESIFGSLIADCVAILTDEPGENRKERKVKTYQKMAAVTGKAELALLVKTADRLANVRACILGKNQRLLDIYKSEHKVFCQSVYREGLCEPLWVELNEIMA